MDRTTKQIFEDIFKNNSWKGRTSSSGRGSDPDQTQNIIKEIPILLKEMKISTILDIPCGNFNWMQFVDLSEIKYIGADIVKEIVKSNKSKYKMRNVSFKYMNLIDSKIPKVNLVLVRDCLVHMSYGDILKLLHNICASKSKYLLTTTFTGRQGNKDITTGGWFPLNIQAAPFLFPEPIRIINEGCTQSRLSYADKSLGLWKISDIAKILKI